MKQKLHPPPSPIPLDNNWDIQLPSFSSKRGHVTEKHVLTGRKHDMLGNQTFEVRRPLRKLSYQSWKAFDVFDKQILPKLRTRYSSVQGFQKWSNSDDGYSTNKWNLWKVSYVPFVYSNVWLPSLSCLRPVRTCFSVTCPHLDENDGMCYI